jgi:cell division protein FtsX
MAVAAISAAAIAVLLLAIVTEADWNVKRCCTDFEPEPETMNQQEMLAQENERT